MSKIKILPEKLANQIAAGEVVERPASVVKELVENAIDANATHISVQVEDAGARLIRVIDDGEGMDQDDALLCLERHATSKIIKEQQLAAIETLGFRGEAISSIASVSRLSIISRRSTDTLGTRADVRFGQVMKVHETGCGHGTIMEVRDLFGNVPARKKFLKSAKTELSHIEEFVKSCGLARPGLGVTYTVNGKEVFNWPGQVDTLESRLKRLIGRHAEQRLIAVDSVSTDKDDQAGMRVFGYLFPPDFSSGVSPRLRLFINGRVIRDRMISHAVAEGLHGFLMKGRRPVGAIFIEIDPASIDVNVHPAKQEIRFHKSNMAHQLIVKAVSRAMDGYQQELKHSVFGPPKSSEQENAVGLGARAYDEGVEKKSTLESSTKEPAPFFAARASAEKNNSFLSESTTVTVEGLPVPNTSEPPLPSVDECFQSSTVSVFDNESLPVEAIGQSPQTIDAGSLKPIGQVLDSFIICEGAHGLVVIDQHAAHERLLFEKIKKQFAEQGIARQSLLFPKVVEVNASEENILRKYGREISCLGIDIQEFGGTSFVVKAIPALMAGIPPEEIMAGIFEQFASDSRETKLSDSRRLENIFASMACKAAIKAGYSLELEEIAQLLREMQKADTFSHCPHGRPVAKSFSGDDMKRWFYRT